MKEEEEDCLAAELFLNSCFWDIVFRFREPRRGQGQEGGAGLSRLDGF